MTTFNDAIVNVGVQRLLNTQCCLCVALLSIDDSSLQFLQQLTVDALLAIDLPASSEHLLVFASTYGSCTISLAKK